MDAENFTAILQQARQGKFCLRSPFIPKGVALAQFSYAIEIIKTNLLY